MNAKLITASIFVFLTLVGTIVALATNHWLAFGDLSFIGLVQTCLSSSCINNLHLQPAYIRATFGLMIISGFCSLMTFILMMVIFQKKTRRLALAVFIVDCFAISTLVVGCSLWTGYTVRTIQDAISLSVGNGVFTFRYSFFIAWTSCLFSLVALFAIIFFWRELANPPDISAGDIPYAAPESPCVIEPQMRAKLSNAEDWDARDITKL